jgi:CRISPR/Cas system CMR-associated protein Cmr1 (group 7 of RAMP superfamily)
MKNRLQENHESARTIFQNKSSFTALPSPRASKKMKNENSQGLNRSTGSLKDFFDKTPENPKYFKRYAENLLKSNNIFTPETPKFKKGRGSVEIDSIKLRSDYAGIKSKQIDEVKYFNETNFL